ncbi:GNAT family N-acetyltransferase [Caproicibacter fermentans]|uniref:GNAT family N-acetyltransferase n=1 Tax=Caproicibacter fermentans TaxID=2576756 RepID=A0A7G8T7F1_9FIRM|nr:GNAT family N-acetyltransferase [Caproicibacter fermentans]QNK39542.1 GNAT family N-acetyltransferase [Caproicibacter fermentans]
MELLIRTAEKSDYGAVHELLCCLHRLHVSARPDVFAEADPMTEEEYASLLENAGKFTIVAQEKEGGVAGFCSVTLRSPSERPELKKRTVAFVNDLCVMERLRNRGIGKRLLEEARNISRRKGAESMELTVWSFNRAAYRLYREMGMSERSIILEQRL